MTTTTTEKADLPWVEANQAYLQVHLSRIGSRLQEAIEDKRAVDWEETSYLVQIEEARAALVAESALDRLVDAFNLSEFERDVLLLCVGVELDSRFASAFVRIQGDAKKTYPTFGIGLSLFENSYWAALGPDAPLRRWRLVEVGDGPTLVESPLRIDERILHFLCGVDHLDERLDGFVTRIQESQTLVAKSHLDVSRRIQNLWVGAENFEAFPVIQLRGDDDQTMQAIACSAAAGCGLNVMRLSLFSLPLVNRELVALRRLWQREALLSSSVLYIDCPDTSSLEPGRLDALNRWVEQSAGALILAANENLDRSNKRIQLFDIARPQTGEQKSYIEALLGERANQLNGQVDRLVSQFNLTERSLYHACRRSLLDAEDGPAVDESAFTDILWSAFRREARPAIDGLAQRIESKTTLEDLILPEKEKVMIREIQIQVRQRAKVYQHWGFSEKSNRGLGISALFAGPSGTGKTMAAEVIANALKLDLYRIDLSSVVSKYIGDTEKNLRKVFDAAESGGAVILFDEADALFGKRSEVKDSHDRHANIEVSYLLQRMEAYRGLAILTTNQREALDTAFLRRIRFVVEFPFPDPTHRALIWKSVFPSRTPIDSLDFDRLARLSIAGGNIRNIAMNAAFAAADEDAPVRMRHIQAAVRSEFSKLEKPISEMEIERLT